METADESVKNGHRASSGAVRRRALWIGLAAFVAIGGCASQGDFLRLQDQVNDMNRTGRGTPDPFARIAQLSNDVDAMREEIRRLEGELQIARKESADALAEVQRAFAAASDKKTGAVKISVVP